MPLTARARRRWIRRVVFLAAALAATPAASAQAATVTVQGKVIGASGYTVNAVASGGQAVSQRLAASGKFKLRLASAQAKGTTLQLIGRDGRYFGPIVLARKTGKAYVALSGRSVSLGVIKLHAGFALAVRPAAARALSSSAARADKHGRPLGAGKLGLVAKSGAKASDLGPGKTDPGGGGGATGGDATGGEDPDRDGVPNAFDADDDGDLKLDGVDSGASSSAGLFSTLFLGFTNALNANAGATLDQIDPVLAGEGSFNMIFFFDGGAIRGRTATGAHVDCFELSYCQRGSGTAILTGLSESSPSLPRNTPWVGYNPDGSGYPNLEPISLGGRPVFAAGIQPHATTSQLRPGDTYNVVFATGDGPVTVPTTLSAYFVTTPAIVSYSSGGPDTRLTYPLPPGSPGCCGPGEGTPDGNPIVLQSDRLTLTFWRPQREAIPGAESGDFIDMGGLNYGVVPSVAGVAGEFSCAGQYSALSPTLTAAPSTGTRPEDGALLFPLKDSGSDAAPSPDRTLSFTVDVGACLRAAGVSSAGRTVSLTLTAAGDSRPGGQDRAAQRFAVKLP